MQMVTRRESFVGTKFRLARMFHGLTQAELSSQLNLNYQWISALESGHVVPTTMQLQALCQQLDFLPSFFKQPLFDEFRDEECHFRRRSTTSLSARNRVLAHGTLFGQLTNFFDSYLSLPEDRVPSIRVDHREDIECAAETCRKRWGLGLDTPILNFTRILEHAGIIVTEVRGYAESIDAFSRSGRRHVLVLNTEKQSASRSRFDMAHECGHLVMHGGMETGSLETEAQANQFASALLLPRAAFVNEFPQNKTMQWNTLFKMKQRWRVSVAAILRRAFELHLIDTHSYQKAYRFMNAQGWRTHEPHEFDREQPELMMLSLRELEETLAMPKKAIAQQLGWGARIFETVTGIAFDPKEQIEMQQNNVIQMALFRH